MKKILIISFFVILSTCLGVTQEKNIDLRDTLNLNSHTFTTWIVNCEKLPKNRDGACLQKNSGFFQFGSKQEQWKEFKRVLDLWMEQQATGDLARCQNWMVSNNGKKQPSSEFFDVSKSKVVFTPYAQKLIIKPGQEVILRGDLHGDIASLVKQLNDLREDGTLDKDFKIKEDQKVIFLGDYVDRGNYGAEVLYTMMQFSLLNPGKVVFVRGNHEDLEVSEYYGFKREVQVKFEDYDGQKHVYISRMNDFLPVVLYLGCKDAQMGITNYLQCCHGGVEQGYNPKVFLDNDESQFQMIGVLHRRRIADELIQKKDVSAKIKNAFIEFDYMIQDNIYLYKPVDNNNALGCMWNDFDVENRNQLCKVRGCALQYGKEITKEILEKHSSEKSKIRGIMRAHQHTGDAENGMMKGLVQSNGVYKLWKTFEQGIERKLDDGIVWTFNVAPDTGYGKSAKFDFDVRAHIRFQEKYENWRMFVKNCSPFE